MQLKIILATLIGIFVRGNATPEKDKAIRPKRAPTTQREAAPQTPDADLFSDLTANDPAHAAAQVASTLTQNKKLADAEKAAPTPANAKALARSNAKTKALTDAALGKFPDDVPLQVLGAASAGQLGDAKAAASRAQRAVELGQSQLGPATDAGAAEKRDNLANALTMRAAVAAQMGDKRSAMADVERALKLAPGNEAARLISKLLPGHQLHDIAVKIPATGDPSAAAAIPDGEVIARMRAAVIRQVVNRPEGFDASVGLTRRAETSLRLEDYRKMRDDATAALSRLPDNPKAYMQRAFASLMLKDYPQAEADATSGLKLKPGASSLLGLRAAAYNETGRPQDALADANAAVKGNPNEAFAWLQKGLAREKLAEGGDEYLKDIKIAADLDPELDGYYQEALARHAQGGESGGAPHDSSPAAQPDGAAADLREIRPRHLYIFSAALVAFSAIVVLIARRRQD